MNTTKARMRVEQVTFERVLGEVIYEERKARGLDQITVSEAAGLSQSTWSRVERGNSSPPIDTLHRIAIALGVPLAKLIERAEAQWDAS